MNTTDDQVIVFSYWAGSLPNISELHFRSFRANNPGVKYVLHLDSTAKYSSFVNAHLMKVLLDCDIEVKSYSLEQEMAEVGVPAFPVPYPRIVQRIGRRFLKSAAHFLHNRSNFNIPGMYFSDELGWTLWHKSRFSNLIEDLAYRSDLFRTIKLIKTTDRHFIYSDIDISFCRPLKEMKIQKSFTSQWGTSNFANTAFLLIQSSNGIARTLIHKEITLGKPALPWILFTREFCETINLNILDINLFDPAWTTGSSIEGRSDLFFSDGPHVEIFLREVELRNWMVHWHNQWSTAPQVNSPYMRQLSKFMS